jgi:hypothetical protein
VALLATAGAVVCTVCDHLHAAFGILYYAHPDAWQQAWWVPLLFAGSSVAMLVGAIPVRRLLGGGDRERDTSVNVIAAPSLAFIAAYVFTALFAYEPDVVLGVLTLAWLVRVVRGVPRWLAVYSLFVAILGPAVEHTLSSLGLFAYLAPDVVKIPRWLPALYLHAGLIAGPALRWVEA